MPIIKLSGANLQSNGVNQTTIHGIKCGTRSKMCEEQTHRDDVFCAQSSSLRQLPRAPKHGSAGVQSRSGAEFVGSGAFGWTEKFIDGVNNRSVVNLTSASTTSIEI